MTAQLDYSDLNQYLYNQELIESYGQGSVQRRSQGGARGGICPPITVVVFFFNLRHKLTSIKLTRK